MLYLLKAGVQMGDEVYFETPLKVGEENGQMVVDIGDIAYGPPETRCASSLVLHPLAKQMSIKL